MDSILSCSYIQLSLKNLHGKWIAFVFPHHMYSAFNAAPSAPFLEPLSARVWGAAIFTTAPPPASHAWVWGISRK